MLTLRKEVSKAVLRSNGYVSNARRQRLTVGELSLSRPEEFAQDFDERMSKEAEMISQQPIVLNETTEAVYAGEDPASWVQYRGEPSGSKL